MTRAMGIGSKAAALHDESCAALRPADLLQLDLRALLMQEVVLVQVCPSLTPLCVTGSRVGESSSVHMLDGWACLQQ